MQHRRRRHRSDTPPGPMALFRNKVREPVSLTLTKAHHEKVKAATAKLGITRADLLGWLIEHMDVETIQLSPAERARLVKVTPFQPSKPESVVN